MSALWQVEAATKIFLEGEPGECRALDRVDLEVRAGTWTVLRGPSGSGKSTLLSLLGGLARPTSGRIRFRDQVLSALSERFLSEFRRREVGFVFQQFHLIRGLSARQNVELPGVPTGESFAARRARALDLLAEVGLTEKAGVRVEHLSGGEAQRVALARALFHRPQALLADEPTANLDPQGAESVLAQLARLRAEGTTLVMTSHDPKVWGAPGVDRVVPLESGRIGSESP